MKYLIFCLMILVSCADKKSEVYTLIIKNEMIVCMDRQVFDYGTTLKDCTVFDTKQHIANIQSATNYIIVPKEAFQ